MHRTSLYRRVTLPLVALAAVTLAPVTGCNGYRFRSPIVSTSGDTRTGPGQMSAAAVQSELMSFTDTLSGSVAQAWNEVAAEGRAVSAPQGLAGSNEEHASRLRRAALANKLATVSAALSIATSPNPNVGLADMITMITLQRMVLEAPAALELYGPERTARLVGVYREQEERAWRIALRAMTPEQQQELREMIAEWRSEHPDAVYVASVRLEDFATRRQQTFVRGSRSNGSLLSLLALDPLAGLDPAQREVEKSRMLGERMFFYASRSPQLLKWQVESLYQDLLRTPEAKKALTSIDSATTGAAKVAALAEDLPKEVAAERSAALNELFTRLAAERHDALLDTEQMLARQRTATIKELDQAQGQLQGTLAQYREATEATQKMASTLNETINAADKLAVRFAPEPGAPKQDTIGEVKAAATEAGTAAVRLNTLVESLDKLTEPGAPEGNTKLHVAAADLQVASREVIDHAFGRLLVLVIVAPFAAALAALGYRAVTRRWRSE